MSVSAVRRPESSFGEVKQRHPFCLSVLDPAVLSRVGILLCRRDTLARPVDLNERCWRWWSSSRQGERADLKHKGAQLQRRCYSQQPTLWQRDARPPPEQPCALMQPQSRSMRCNRKTLSSVVSAFGCEEALAVIEWEDVLLMFRRVMCSRSATPWKLAFYTTSTMSLQTPVYRLSKKTALTSDQPDQTALPRNA